MLPQTIPHLLLLGLAVGAAFAALGALAEYWFNLRKKRRSKHGRGSGCLLYTAGALMLLGVGVLLAAWALTDAVTQVAWLLAGVCGGFYLTFCVLFLTWVLWLGRE